MQLSTDALDFLKKSYKIHTCHPHMWFMSYTVCKNTLYRALENTSVIKTQNSELRGKKEQAVCDKPVCYLHVALK